MFDREIGFGTARRRWWVTASFAAHIVATAALIYAWPDLLLTASVSMAKVSPGSSPKASYITFAGLTTPSKLTPAVPHPKLAIRHHPAPTAAPAPTAEPDLHALAALIGPILKGDAVLYPGIHDIKVALPQNAPTPDVRRSDIPFGYQGDVVVDVVIDKTGKVVSATVKQGFARLEAKVVSTVLNWHFSPATYDGVPASVQEVHFHYPDSAKTNLGSSG